MWFTNITVYQLHNAQAIDSITLHETLQAEAAKPLGNTDAKRHGWTPPAGRASNAYLHESQGHRLLSMLKQQRMLPPKVVKAAVEEKAAEVEANEGRKVTRKEKTAFKEQITEELLPRAFIDSVKIDAWWDVEKNRIIINSGSRARCEELLDLLRETLGSLKATPLSTQTLPIRAMTTWVSDAQSRPANLQLGDKATLKAKGDDGKIAATQVDLDSDEIQQLLESGRQATNLAITIDERVSGVLTDTLQLKGLRFSDQLIEQADMTETKSDDGDDAIARLEADFFLMANALSETLDSLVHMLGGETVREVAAEKGTRPDDSHPGEQIGGFEKEEPLLKEAIELVKRSPRDKLTVSKLQRHFKIGYNRAAWMQAYLIQNGHIPDHYAQLTP